MAIGKSLNDLLARLNYNFTNEELLQNALTHSSYSNEFKSKGLNIPSNERLEFLGDSVLEIVISDYLFRNFTQLAEGKLTKMRQNLVCERTLARVASGISLGEYLHLGKGEENDCRFRPKVLADALEAVFGAMYIDCQSRSSVEYYDVIIGLFLQEITDAADMSRADFKTNLQQFIEKDGSAVLEYEIVDESGPEHDKVFTAVCKVNNNDVGRGVARSKKEAQMLAAKEALKLFGLL